MAVTLERRDPSAGTVALLGENDGYAAARLEHELAMLLEARAAIVVDLTEATFVDSQVLSVLLSAQRDAEGAGLGYGLVLPETGYTQVHRILEMTGLRSAFAVYATKNEALAATRTSKADGAHSHAA